MVGLAFEGYMKLDNSLGAQIQARANEKGGGEPEYRVFASWLAYLSLSIIMFALLSFSLTATLALISKLGRVASVDNIRLVRWEPNGGDD